MSMDPSDCTVQIPAGPGVINHDYILYIMADQSFCQSDTLLAFATGCIIEPVQDRPIAGFINYCPDAVGGGDPESTFAVTKHEIMHAMGFLRALMPFWRDPANNQPRTPRDPVTGLPPFEPETG